MPSAALSMADYSVLALGLSALVFLGIRFSREQRSTQDFFLARRSIPGWAAGLSFVAAEVSALTIVSVPGTAFSENWEYAQFFIGSALARVAIAVVFLPVIYDSDCVTIYEYLGRRFGPQTRQAGVGFFFVTRLLASAVRLTAATVAVSLLLGWNFAPTLILFTVISIVYVGAGGVKAVIWNGVIQGGTFLAAGGVVLAVLAARAGGPAGIIETAAVAGRLDFFDWGPPAGDPEYWKNFLANPNVIWLAILNGFVTSLAAFGTDHDQMQRLLTVETRRASQRTLVTTMFWSGLVLVLYLSIGSGLFAYYAQHPDPGLPLKADKVLPYFVLTAMPDVLRGLMLTAIVMASIDSPLGSLATTFVNDLYRPFAPGRNETHLVLISRIAVAVFGIILAGLSYGFHFLDKFLWLAFKIGGVTFGSLLGIFLLGLLTRRGRDAENVMAMTVAALVNFTLLVCIELKLLSFGWSWLVILGTAVTVGMAGIFPGRIEREEDRNVSAS